MPEVPASFFLHTITVVMSAELIMARCVFITVITDTISLSKDNEAARRRCRRRIVHTLKKPTTMPTKLAKEGELV
jgi:hypothetical protein